MKPPGVRLAAVVFCERITVSGDERIVHGARDTMSVPWPPPEGAVWWRPTALRVRLAALSEGTHKVSLAFGPIDSLHPLHIFDETVAVSGRAESVDLDMEISVPALQLGPQRLRVTVDGEHVGDGSVTLVAATEEEAGQFIEIRP